MTELFTPEYLHQLELMRTAEHRPNWGNGGKVHFEYARKLIEEQGHKTVLDYGCGHGKLLRSLVSFGTVRPGNAQFYDPGIPAFAGAPRPAELVLSTDVLEHIEPHLLDNVLDDIRRLTLRTAYLHVAVTLAKAILPDGRNAHLIVEPPAWWKVRLEARYGKVEEHYQRDGFIHPTFICHV